MSILKIGFLNPRILKDAQLGVAVIEGDRKGGRVPRLCGDVALT